MQASMKCIRGVSAAPRSAPRSVVVVRSTGQINSNIKKDVEKVVDTVQMAEVPKAVMCRCWKSAKFPACDGSHVKHNKETGDNVGPLIVENSAAKKA